MSKQETPDEDSFLRGERIIYQEDNAVYDVKVLNNSSCRNLISYELEIMRIIREHGILEDYEVGSSFKCSKLRSRECTGSWLIAGKEEFESYQSPEVRAHYS